MSLSRSRPLLPEGISFDIAELIMLRNWAENNGLRLEIDLDHREGDAEFEEYIGLSLSTGRHRLVILWRAPHAVIVSPFGGRPRQFVSMAHALASLYVRDGIVELRHNRISRI